MQVLLRGIDEGVNYILEFFLLIIMFFQTFPRNILFQPLLIESVAGSLDLRGIDSRRVYAKAAALSKWHHQTNDVLIQ